MIWWMCICFLWKIKGRLMLSCFWEQIVSGSPPYNSVDLSAPRCALQNFCDPSWCRHLFKMKELKRWIQEVPVQVEVVKRFEIFSFFIFVFLVSLFWCFEFLNFGIVILFRLGVWVGLNFVKAYIKALLYQQWAMKNFDKFYCVRFNFSHIV